MIEPKWPRLPALRSKHKKSIFLLKDTFDFFADYAWIVLLVK
jgi:hypothetical protein